MVYIWFGIYYVGESLLTLKGIALSENKIKKGSFQTISNNQIAALASNLHVWTTEAFRRIGEIEEKRRVWDGV